MQDEAGKTPRWDGPAAFWSVWNAQQNRITHIEAALVEAEQVIADTHDRVVQENYYRIVAETLAEEIAKKAEVMAAIATRAAEQIAFLKSCIASGESLLPQDEELIKTWFEDYRDASSSPK